MDRQNSSESISSLNSITSHSSAGSLKEQEAKKKKKKSWVRMFQEKEIPARNASFSNLNVRGFRCNSLPFKLAVLKQNSFVIVTELLLAL